MDATNILVLRTPERRTADLRESFQHSALPKLFHHDVFSLRRAGRPDTIFGHVPHNVLMVTSGGEEGLLPHPGRISTLFSPLL